ncbi:MAG: hypothetical protein JWM69_692 [Candidatus Binatus sp.]|jgi:hypothetical protein|nr:hypothetical protein [Candidatus Binatus sp.]
MKGFDDIAAETFQRNDDGTWIFFPRTRFFSGYEVPNEMRKRELQEMMSQFLEVTLWMTLVGLVITGSLGQLLVGTMALEIAVIAATIRFANRATRGLVKSNVRFDSNKARAMFVSSRSVRRLVAVTAVSIVMTFFSIYAVELQPEAWVSLVPGVLVLSFITTVYVRMLKTKLTLQTMRAGTNQ